MGVLVISFCLTMGDQADTTMVDLCHGILSLDRGRIRWLMDTRETIQFVIVCCPIQIRYVNTKRDLEILSNKSPRVALNL